MIDITIATMGRLTKKRAMAYFASRAGCGRAGAAVATGAGFGATVMPSLNPLQALDDDPLAGLEAFFDHPQRVDALTDLHVAKRHLVVRIHHRDAVEALQLLHGALRNQQRARLGFEQQPRAAVLARAAAADSGLGNSICMPRVPVVGSTARSTGRHAAGVRIDVPSASVSWMPRPRRLAGARRVAPGDAQVVGLGDADAEENRIDLRDGREQRALPRPTRLPGFTCVVPTSPLIGAVTRV